MGIVYLAFANHIDSVTVIGVYDDIHTAKQGCIDENTTQKLYSGDWLWGQGDDESYHIPHDAKDGQKKYIVVPFVVGQAQPFDTYMMKFE